MLTWGVDGSFWDIIIESNMNLNFWRIQFETHIWLISVCTFVDWISCLNSNIKCSMVLTSILTITCNAVIWVNPQFISYFLWYYFHLFLIQKIFIELLLFSMYFSRHWTQGQKPNPNKQNIPAFMGFVF